MLPCLPRAGFVNADKAKLTGEVLHDKIAVAVVWQISAEFINSRTCAGSMRTSFGSDLTRPERCSIVHWLEESPWFTPYGRMRVGFWPDVSGRIQ